MHIIHLDYSTGPKSGEEETHQANKCSCEIAVAHSSQNANIDLVGKGPVLYQIEPNRMYNERGEELILSLDP